MFLRRLLSCVALLTALRAFAQSAPLTLENTQRYRDETLGLEIVAATAKVPAGEFDARNIPLFWADPAEKSVAQVFVIYPPDFFRIDRMKSKQALRREKEEREREIVSAIARHGPADQATLQIIDALARYAKDHDGKFPSFDDEKWLRYVIAGTYIAPPQEVTAAEAAEAAATIDVMPAADDGYWNYFRAAFARVPDVKKSAQPPSPGTSAKAKPAPKKPFFVESTPGVDDGLHWVIFDDLSIERVAIDTALLARAGVTLDLSRALPRPPAEPAGPAAAPAHFEVTVVALRRDASARVAQLQFAGSGGWRSTKKSTPVTWDLSNAHPGERDLLTRWAEQRAVSWASTLHAAPDSSPLLTDWLTVAGGVYGLPDESRYMFHLNRDRWNDNRRGPDAPGLLSLFGGRAAVEETLQLDRLLRENPETGEGAPTPVAAITPVETKSHPFGEMLAALPAASVPSAALPLADCVPVDRSLVYCVQPAALLRTLPGTNDFLAQASALTRASAFDYDLLGRYEEALGLGSGLGRKLIEAGAVRAIALFTSDLAFTTGTEVTLIADLQVPAFAKSLLNTSGGSQPTEVATDSGAPAYHARRDGRYFFSTTRAELVRALALHDAGGRGSLGQSDEFRYMLHKLPPQTRTQAYVYFSDPFIRHLVSPAQRIAQLRQARARYQLEQLAAALALRALDQPQARPDLAELKKLKYLPADWTHDADLQLTPERTVVSKTWGPLHRLHPVERNLPTTATPAETFAYNTFREGYQQFWRRFFDPIALRYDVADDGARTLETFILPLLDNTAYNGLRETVVPGLTDEPLRTPTWKTPMAATLTMQLPERVWEEFPNADSDQHRKSFYWLPSALTEQFGPTLHLALPDADPVLHLGADLGSVFDTQALGGGGRGSIMLMAPIFINFFTRPTVIAIELRDPARARAVLDNFSLPSSDGPLFGGMRDFVRLTSARFADGTLTANLRILGLVSLRQTWKIQGRWLTLTNTPDGAVPPLDELATGEENALPGYAAQLAFQPAAQTIARRSTWLNYLENEMQGRFAAQRWLSPWLDAGATQAEAEQNARRLFGFAPQLPPDALRREGPSIVDTRFGSHWDPLLPATEPKGDFGLFKDLQHARISAKFEDDGLRTKIEWK